jgi:frataxin-like iron-binding protein CyaY
MATTTNYGWTTPDDTALVKDGASAIRSLGSAIDSTLKTQIDAQIPDSIVDAKGDLISATADNTPARLASSGVNGNVLTVDTTTATGLKWAAPASTGITLTQRFNIDSTMYKIAYNGSSLWVAVGASGSLYTSTNGSTWTSRTSGFGANTIQSVSYGNGLWVAVGNNGTITTSTDGTTWTARTSNMSTNTINAVEYANSIWVAVGDGGGSTNTGGITYSTDGITWTRKSQTPSIGTTYYDVAWNGTNWIVGANHSTNNHLYASDPSGTWTAGASGSINTIWRIIWDGTRHITFEGSPAGARYSTSTTLGSTTALKGSHILSSTSLARGQAFLYNGKIYCGGAGYLGSMTVASNEFPLVDPPFIGATWMTSTGISNTNNVLWVGAQGWIVGNGTGLSSSF